MWPLYNTQIVGRPIIYNEIWMLFISDSCFYSYICRFYYNVWNDGIYLYRLHFIGDSWYSYFTCHQRGMSTKIRSMINILDLLSLLYRKLSNLCYIETKREIFTSRLISCYCVVSLQMLHLYTDNTVTTSSVADPGRDGGVHSLMVQWQNRDVYIFSLNPGSAPVV